MDIFLLISDFLVKPQSQQKLAKKSFILQNSFAPKTSFILWTQHYKTYSCNTSKTMLLFGVRKNFSIAPFLGAQEMHFRSTCKSDTWGKGFNSGLSKFCGRQPLRDMVSLVSSVYSSKPLRNYLFQRRWKLSSGVGLNKFLPDSSLFEARKMFWNYHFNWNFWRFEYFLAFRYLHQQHWNAEILQTISSSRVRLWLTFSYQATFLQFIIWLRPRFTLIYISIIFMLLINKVISM